MHSVCLKTVGFVAGPEIQKNYVLVMWPPPKVAIMLVNATLFLNTCTFYVQPR